MLAKKEKKKRLADHFDGLKKPQQRSALFVA